MTYIIRLLCGLCGAWLLVALLPSESLGAEPPTVLKSCPCRVKHVSDRTCFVRMESPALLHFAVTNVQPTPLIGAKLDIWLDGAERRSTNLTELASDKTVVIDYPLDTSLRPDIYRGEARLTVAAPVLCESRVTFEVRIVPREMPHRFPVLMWGPFSPGQVPMEQIKKIGFNHVLVNLDSDYFKIWAADKPTEAADPKTVAQTKRMFDEALANDMKVVASLAPASQLAAKPEFQRVDRKGQPYKVYKVPDVCGLIPQVAEFCYKVGAWFAQKYGGFPAFCAALLHTEVRDRTNLCFHRHDLDAFRNASGIIVPPDVSGRQGILHDKIAGFPVDHVIPDDNPLYVFYRWFWKTGDGWNGINTALHRGLKSTGRGDFWTFHDPAVRVPSVYGSGGAVDVLSHWTYSYPDPIRIAVATDELLAMAKGAATLQNVMKMTQIIWYRSQTAPSPAKVADTLPYQARWEREQPDAQFITIAPMHLREAFWTKIARPIKGIMYHGWDSLVRTGDPITAAAYRFTHSDTQHELARLIHEVVEPLGPTLLQAPGVKSDVAFLESFASEMFAHRGTYGWGGSWLGDAYQVMLYAHLQPEVVFDETICTRGLDGFRVLVMADCDVITESMARQIKAFQKRGGIVVGDDRIAPAIKPDVRLSPYQRTGHNDKDKAALLGIAVELRRQLDQRYSRYADSSNPEVIPYVRRHCQTDYVFLVNDRREYGQYVGQHGIVMENGLPSSSIVTVRRPGGFVYDLVSGRRVLTRQEDGHMQIDADLGPGDGRLYMISPQAIDRVRIEAPATIPRGAHAICQIEVLDSQNRPVRAIVPLRVTISDSAGRPAEFSGHYAAVDGKVNISLDIATNDGLGAWQIEARELASGRMAVRSLRIGGTSPWPPSLKTAPKGVADPVQPQGKRPTHGDVVATSNHPFGTMCVKLSMPSVAQR